MSRYDLTEFEWRVIELLPHKPRGVPRVDDRRVLNGIFWLLRSGSAWRDLPERHGPPTTCCNRFRRWTKAGVRDRIMDAMTDAYGGDVRMIDGTSVRVHHAAESVTTPFSEGGEQLLTRSRSSGVNWRGGGLERFECSVRHGQ